MLEEIKKSTQKEMDQSYVSLVDNLKKVRTGRANVSMLDSIRVLYYGNPAPLNQVATLSCPDAKSYLIAPWETNILKEIESAIVKSDLGMSPINDGKVIRLRVPELTEERRKDLVKNIKKTVEEARVSIRMARRNANDLIKQKHKDKNITDDDKKSFEDTIQKMTDDFIGKIDKLSDEKEKELMTL